MTPTVLDAILEGVREDVADRERAVPRAALAQVPVAAPRPVLAEPAVKALLPPKHGAMKFARGLVLIDPPYEVPGEIVLEIEGPWLHTILFEVPLLAFAGTATPTPAPAPSTSGSTYTVLAGDGWWIISYRTGVSASILQSINGMSSSTMLHPGMVLKTTSVSTSSAPAVAPAPAPASKQAAVDYVRAAVRNPSSYYVWGGNGPSGFDCSGLTQQAMAQAGISIPRRAGDQYLAAKSYVPISQAQPGDLVFYANQSTGRIYHTAMYMGGGQLAHALNEDAGLVFTSTTIMKSDMLAVAARY